MTSDPEKKLPADQVLVTVGTVCGVSAVGTVPTQRALIAGDPAAIGLAARDAGLVQAELTDAGLRFRDCDGGLLDLDTIAERHGQAVRSRMGVRVLDAECRPEHLPADLGAPLPHDLARGGLRRLTGTTFEAVRGSAFRDMFGLFQNDCRLGPSLQAQLFLYGGLGALAALPRPLPELLPEAHRFRVAAACAFAGQEHVHYLGTSMQPGAMGGDGGKGDRLAYRLATSLNTHGPALLNALLSPAFSLSRVRKNPELLDGLLCADGVLRNVPQSPMVLSGACASALLGFADVAPQLLYSNYPGAHAPQLVLWTAADAPLQPDARIIEGFGPGALMSRAKLAELNSGRSGETVRPISQAVAPFDQDAAGTVVGEAGSGVLVTTLQFAVEQGLDVTSIVAGFGQAGESGGKGHFAGVGFGGENALVLALRMAERAHGYGAADFGHLVAHATGTRTNSRTDLVTIDRARRAIADEQRRGVKLPRMTVGAPKALGDGHTMGEAGLRAAAEAIYYVLGEQTVGVPSLRTLDPDLSDCLEHFEIGSAPVAGDEDGGALVFAQGFGGYVAALAFRSANPDSLGRYRFDDERSLPAYLERRSEIRRQRVAREQAARLAQGAALELAARHCYPGLG